MGVRPARCAVIEDSASGIAAGVAAGMSVFGFSGGVTPPAKLQEASTRVFADMVDSIAELDRSRRTGSFQVTR